MSGKRTLFVAGIDTEVGKTVVSSVLVKALRAAYWKPVQSGDLDCSDTMRVTGLVADPSMVAFEEAYRLKTPCSPDASAARDGILIDLERAVQVPDHTGPLVIEGAGGLLVPLNAAHLIIDLIARIGAPVVLVSRHYLGSINHTLLSCDALKSRGIPVLGIVFNGEENPETEESIKRFSQVPIIGRIDQETELTPQIIDRWAARFRESPLLQPFFA